MFYSVRCGGEQEWRHSLIDLLVPEYVPGPHIVNMHIKCTSIPISHFANNKKTSRQIDRTVVLASCTLVTYVCLFTRNLSNNWSLPSVAVQWTAKENYIFSIAFISIKDEIFALRHLRSHPLQRQRTAPAVEAKVGWTGCGTAATWGLLQSIICNISYSPCPVLWMWKVDMWNPCRYEEENSGIQKNKKNPKETAPDLIERTYNHLEDIRNLYLPQSSDVSRCALVTWPVTTLR